MKSQEDCLRKGKGSENAESSPTLYIYLTACLGSIYATTLLQLTQLCIRTLNNHFPSYKDCFTVTYTTLRSQ